MFIPLTVICAFTVLFVGWEVVERHLFPTMSIGLRHALLSVRAGVVTAVASGIVYLLMRSQQQRLSRTAGQLTRLLESWQNNPSEAGRFENPHLVHCREVIECDRTDCPMYDSPGERCWQVMALSRTALEGQPAAVEIEECHECQTYRLSCPDRLTELGESFNNLMFLLERQTQQVDHMRAQMVEREKMVAIGQIAAGIAHEVGNPLSSISSIVQMLKRKQARGTSVEQLDLIESHIGRISAIVRQLVGLARPGPERWELVDVGKILEEAVRLISFDRRARNVKIDFEAPPPLPRTYGLKGLLEQVFINLSLNALDAMPDGGKLTIRANRMRGSITARIEDTGCGIPAETGRRVFEPFFTTKEPGHGTGLGLTVSYGIIQKHGGSIDVESAAGKGAAFTVRIPVLDKPPDA